MFASAFEMTELGNFVLCIFTCYQQFILLGCSWVLFFVTGFMTQLTKSRKESRHFSNFSFFLIFLHSNKLLFVDFLVLPSFDEQS